ncbi:MAG: YncE family protein [Thaumarchaeota archaeon]|nr:YncE family protein [Nitrososphaerota archaeon]
MRVDKRARRIGLIVSIPLALLLIVFAIASAQNPTLTEALNLNALAGVPGTVAHEAVSLVQGNALPDQSPIEQVGLNAIVGLAGGETEGLGLLTTTSVNNIRTEALNLLATGVQTVTTNLESISLGGGATLPSFDGLEVPTLISFASLPSHGSLEVLNLVSGAFTSGQHAEGMTLVTSASGPSTPAKEVEGACLYAAVGQAAPELQNCNNGGGGITTAINVGTHPWGVAYDPSNGEVYITNYGQGTVSIVKGVSLLSTVNVGQGPVAAAYDAVNGDIYVANAEQGTVTVISGVSASVVATVTVGTDPQGVAFASNVGEVYVTNNGAGTLSEISSATNTVIATVTVGGFPSGIAYDPTNGLIYVAQEAGDSVSVLNPTTNAVTATVHVGTFPSAVAYDATDNDVYVTNYLDGTVSVINSAEQVVQTVSVGNLPDGVAVNQSTGTVYVTCGGDNAAWLISPKTDQPFFILQIGRFPQGLAYDVANGGMYVAQETDDTVGIIYGP